MKALVFCAIVIAGSTFTMAVEDVYGWSKVRPHAEAAWDYAYELGAELAGIEAHAKFAIEAPREPGSGSAEASE
jgi:hypothetical protein